MNIVLLLGLLLIAGLAATRATRLAKLPNVTGFLVVGLLFAIVCIVIDKSVNDPEKVHLAETLTKMNEFVSTVALGFIALSIGEEFKLSKIKQYGKKITIITFLQAFLAIALVDIALVILCLALGLSLAIAICLGAVAAATAPAATLMVIHQYKAKGPLVDVLLPVVAFDDAIGLIVFSISVAVSKVIVTNGNIDFMNLALIPLLEIVGSLAVGFILGYVMHLFMKAFKSRNNHMIVIIAFTLLGVGACEALNLIKINGTNLEFSSLLTCMMIGAVYVNLPKEDELSIVTRDIELMDRWTGFLFTLFFVLSGAHLATSAYEIFTSGTTDVLPIVLIFVVYIIARSSGKYFGSFLGSCITRQPKPIRHYLGFTLLPQAGVAIGMANSISRMPVFAVDNIGNIIVTVVLCATLVYELFGPLLTKWSLYRAGEIPQDV